MFRALEKVKLQEKLLRFNTARLFFMMTLLILFFRKLMMRLLRKIILRLFQNLILTLRRYLILMELLLRLKCMLDLRLKLRVIKGSHILKKRLMLRKLMFWLKLIGLENKTPELSVFQTDLFKMVTSLLLILRDFLTESLLRAERVRIMI